MQFQDNVNGKIQCLICPRKCILAEGQKGFCYVRENKNGKINSVTYGYNTGLSIDPIEKKPLYHFYPNSKILSFGTLGCCMGCKFCQNWHITKNTASPKIGQKILPFDIVNIAKKYSLKYVAFTYNDPIVFFEYALDTAKLCAKEGIKTTAVTSGFMNLDAAFEFYKYMDSANIDLKAFSENFYRRNCLASLAPVLETIKYTVLETNCHVELTTMLIEGENDSYEMIKNECEWILENLGACIPLHFSAFIPHYKFKNRKKTEFKTLLNARKIALDTGLKYVYTGNISTRETSSTYCKKCGKLLISRMYPFEINLKNGACIFCGEKLDGQF
ncbi:MAG: AmmeMemoRadiSam system radical SAM enzyme [Candidatus Gastranaerophilales bacterium]|nr:AmmeMemoRadiSam system radical SAM enzyme [Candidatus Gastranaerophilales bacterium]